MGHDHLDPLGEHISPLSMYIGVFGALLVLTVLTVLVSTSVDLGAASIFVAMGIALVKGTLVATYFMHLKYDTKLNVFVFISSLLFMGIFFAFTATDLGYRGQVNPMTDTFVLRHEEAAMSAEEARRAEAAAKAAAAMPAAQVAPVNPAPAAPPAPAPVVAPAAAAPVR